jgi:signal peptidase I
VLLFERAGAASERARFHATPAKPFSTRRLPQLGRASSWAIAVAVVVGGAFAIRASFPIYRVASASMEPTLHCAGSPDCRRLEGDVVVVSRLIYRVSAVKRGDIVAFTMPPTAPLVCRGGGVRLKRVVGLPGEVVSMRGSRGGGRGRPVRAPRDHYFLIGDNPHGSCDSRQVGAIPRQNLLGKVILVYSPPWGLRRP